MPHTATSCRSLAGLRPIPCTSSPTLDSDDELSNYQETLLMPLARIEVESQACGKFKQLIKIPIRRDQFIRIGSGEKRLRAMIQDRLRTVALLLTCISNLRIKDAGVSPVHCEIYSVVFESDERCISLIYVRDCQSITGTHVNGHRIGKGPYITSAQLLENDDIIRVGPCRLQVRSDMAQGGDMALSRTQREETSLFEDHYVVRDIVIGHGSYGTVHLAVNVKTNRQVICKVHDLEGLENLEPFAIRGVDQEMFIWSHLDHPNIIAFQRAFRTNKNMEVWFAGGRHGVSVDIWAIGVLTLQLIAGDDPVDMPLEFADMSEIGEFVWSVLYKRMASMSEPMSDSGLRFLMACLNLDPSKRPSAKEASGHIWLTKQPERSIFEERERQLAWEPRDILIPAVVDLREATRTVFGSEYCAMHDASELEGSQESEPDDHRLTQETSPASKVMGCPNQRMKVCERGQTTIVTNGNPVAANGRNHSAP
ncbi:serine/threonine-protein kinase [Grosmannia clavigera kw1407]|uniref:non-specific serine/threonine protein kinase n=1 Tax=Grosmannia clavigera (strain kw1407 / UAMH 11150) TaxID=655863 RepID=F0XUD0_GROCL|nr:serine/threonine-protein kinase [Grosmannia clavigera kw1407]EFW98761.1 serine/threonine-protein kinase [Grosmannia clavigera kw1407]